MKRKDINLQICALTGLTLLALTAYAAGQPSALDLVCSGNSYKQDGPFPTPVTVSFRIGGTKSVLIGEPGSQKPMKASIVSDNAIQLKFKTGSYTGEYFHFTGDLFLIHSDGHLTRLSCKPP